jgi:hypothetical protein
MFGRPLQGRRAHAGRVVGGAACRGGAGGDELQPRSRRSSLAGGDHPKDRAQGRGPKIGNRRRSPRTPRLTRKPPRRRRPRAEPPPAPEPPKPDLAEVADPPKPIEQPKPEPPKPIDDKIAMKPMSPSYLDREHRRSPSLEPPPEAKKPEPPKPAPPKPQPKHSVESVVDDILKNKEANQKIKTPEQQPKPLKEITRQAAAAPNLAAVVTASEIEGVKNKIRECWFMPGGSRDSPIISMVVQMNQNGTPESAEIKDTGRYNNDPLYRAAADAARRAVLNPRCHPWPLAAEKYTSWRHITFTWDPRDY